MTDDKGNPFATFNYAGMLYKGERFSVDTLEAVKYYKMAADGGCVEVMNNYAYNLYKGDGIEQNVEEAVKHYKMSIEKGCVGAMFNYA